MKRNLLTLRQFTEANSWPTMGALRNLIFFAKENGFDSVIRRVGTRILIDEESFYRWVDDGQKPKEGAGHEK